MSDDEHRWLWAIPYNRRRDHEYYHECNWRNVPYITVTADGPRYARIKFSMGTTGHRLTEETFENVLAILSDAIDRHGLRRGTTVAAGAGDSVWARRIPRGAVAAVIDRVIAHADAPGAATLAFGDDGPARLALARGIPYSWRFVESLSPGDYRAELFNESRP